MKYLAVSIVLFLGVVVFSSIKLPNRNIQSTTHTLVFSKSNGREVVCTSVALGPKVLLTAAHCLVSNKVIVDGKPVTIVKVIKDGSDHALLMIEGRVFRSWSFLSTSSAIPGEDIYVVGDADGFNKLVRKGVVAGYDTVETASGLSEDVLLLDINGTSGDSGAAVFGTNGQVYTVLSAEYTNGGFSLMMAFSLRFTERQLKEAREF